MYFVEKVTELGFIGQCFKHWIAPKCFYDSVFVWNKHQLALRGMTTPFCQIAKVVYKGLNFFSAKK